MAAALQKATDVANGYHSSAIRQCNKARFIAEDLDAQESHDEIADLWKAVQKVRDATVAAADEFTTVFLKVTKDDCCPW